MRVDHIAYRVAEGKRDEAVEFFMKAFGYRFQAEFEIHFNDAKTDKALCVALEPPEKKVVAPFVMPFKVDEENVEYHLAPEIFVSEGTPGSIVHNWVQSRAGVGGVHHIAYQVDDVEATMKKWMDNGWGNFTSAKPMQCPGLTQVFSKPNCTGVIYEFIKREGYGFCQSNVKALMESTAQLDKNIP
jgi:4-hydroxyphenylpyruvate dioxygenase-like putative hemolysin